MGRVRTFAAPFVVTAALSGCKGESKQEAPPPPRVQPDAQVIVARPPDAAPAPDAVGGLPKAPADATTIKFTNGGCYTFPSNTQVVCPDAPTLAMANEAWFPDDNKPRDRIRYDLWKGSCLEQVGGCPPDETASCNPPPPRPVRCPQAKLPTLAAGLEPTKRAKGRCYWHAGDVDLEVKCP